MNHICIISSSIRKGRYSHRAAIYLSGLLKEKYQVEAEILDLHKYNFPLFEERLKYLDSPSPGTLDFAERVRKADGLIFVVPEYNGGYSSCRRTSALGRDRCRSPAATALSRLAGWLRSG